MRSVTEFAKSLVSVYPSVDALASAATLGERKPGEPTIPYVEYMHLLNERKQAVSSSLNLPLDSKIETCTLMYTQYFAIIKHHSVVIMNGRDGLFVGVFDADMTAICAVDAIVGQHVQSFETALIAFLIWADIDSKAETAEAAIEAIRNSVL